MPTATQLASGCAGAFNPCPDLGHTSRPLRAPRPPTKVARGRRRWGLAARPAGLARAPGPREALPGSHPAVGDTGGSARGDLPPQVTAGDRSHSCGAPPAPQPAGGADPRRARHAGGAAPDSGLSSRGNLPRAAPRSFLSHPPRPGLGGRSARGPGRGLGESRPLPPRRVQKDARRPALPRRPSDWKGERAAGEPGEPRSRRAWNRTRAGERTAAGTLDGREGAGPGRAGSPGSGADPVAGSAGLPALEALGHAGGRGTRVALARNPLGCSVADPR